MKPTQTLLPTAIALGSERIEDLQALRLAADAVRRARGYTTAETLMIVHGALTYNKHLQGYRPVNRARAERLAHAAVESLRAIWLDAELFPTESHQATKARTLRRLMQAQLI